MKVFLAGASGAVGTRLIPQLIADGNEVVATTRSPTKAPALRALGAEPVIADALSRESVMQAVMRAEPDAVIHQLTALTGIKSFKKFDQEFALTNRLRTEGIDYLLKAARAAGASRFIAQSYGNWTYERTGTALKTEEDALDPNPPANQVRSLAAIRHLEAAVTGAEGLVGIALRYGGFYGPGTDLSTSGTFADLIKKRRFPIVGDGAGVWTFTHIDDAASAAVAALHRGEAGVYNIIDDEPAPVSEWLPYLAEVLGAKPPRHVPVWLGRIAAGEVGVSMMTQIRGASNAKAKRELGWAPRWRSYKEGFRDGLIDTGATSGAARAADGARAERS
jgi:nucleoside-diphosphate-sugar epimerase